MSTATHYLNAPAPVSKIDTTDWSRELWHEAFAMARRMVKPRPGHSTGDALTWYFDHGFRRFGYAALPIVRAAGWAVFTRISQMDRHFASAGRRLSMQAQALRLNRAVES